MDDALKCTVYGYRQNSENLCSLLTTFAALFDLYSLVMALVTVSQKAFLLVLSTVEAFSPNTHNSLESCKFSQLAKNVVSENFPCAA